MSGRVVGRALCMIVAGCFVVPSLAAARGGSTRRRHVPPAERARLEWPRPEVMELAEQAWRCGRDAGHFDRPILTVIDYSLPSTARRLWVIDLGRRRVLFHELVAHGEGSGDDRAAAFSNRPGSRQSSLGLFRTEHTYVGQHGQALRLSGLEPGVNDRAMERAIVIHGAPYVSPVVAASLGRLGRSWGCPALDRAVHRRVIDTIRDGTAVFAYYPDRRWLARSPFIGCEARLARGGK